jgi:hypothetical protein
LILLVLLWKTRERSGNTFFPFFNHWAESLFPMQSQAKQLKR